MHWGAYPGPASSEPPAPPGLPSRSYALRSLASVLKVIGMGHTGQDTKGGPAKVSYLTDDPPVLTPSLPIALAPSTPPRSLGPLAAGRPQVHPRPPRQLTRCSLMALLWAVWVYGREVPPCSAPMG